MRYFTKDWFHTRTGSDIYFLMKPATEAEAFNEDFYQTLYNSKLAEHLNTYLEMSKLTVDDVFPENAWSTISTIDSEGNFVDAAALMSVEEYEKIKEDIRRKEQEARANFVPVVYDEPRLTVLFQNILKVRQEVLKELLPEDIVKDVADIRVLALDHASCEISRRICSFCMAKENITFQTEQDYQAYYKSIEPLLPPKIKQNYGFHDCRIMAIKQQGSDIIVTLDIRGGQTNVNQMIYHNATISEQDDVIGTTWLYQEIYIQDDGYEFHAATQGDDGKYRYLTVKAWDVDFEMVV